MFWEAGFSCFFVRGRHIAASDERGAALVVRRLTAAYVRADAKRRCSASWDRESRAVAALRPAGYSSGRGDCARGGCSAGRCGSCAGLRSSYAGRAAFTYGVCARYRGGAFVRHYMMVNRGPAKGCVWPVIAPAEGIVRAGGCVRSMPVVRYWDVLCSFAPIIRSCRSVLCSITPAVCRMSAKQDGLRYVPFLFRRVEIAISAFSGCRAVIGLGWFTSGLCVSLWRSRQGTKRRGNAENGVGGEIECVFA